MNKLYDTCALLDGLSQIKLEKEIFYISSISLLELESIKTSNKKDNTTKMLARKVLHFLDTHPEKYRVEVCTQYYHTLLEEKGLPITNDNLIIAAAYNLNAILITNDLAAKHIAKEIFKIEARSIVPYVDDYTGYVELEPTEAQWSNLYQDVTLNIFSALPNQYLILKQEGAVKDIVCWTGKEYRTLKYGKDFSSKWLGDLKPKDVYQKCAMDAVCHNKLTLLRGPGGSGKSMIALHHLMSAFEKGKIDRIILFCNPVATKDAARLGFYTGSRLEKLMDAQVGNFLTSKFGDKEILEGLISTNKIMLLPMSDVRGFDTSGMNAGVYITEAQNLSVDLIKLAIQRIGEDSFLILDGDDKTQVDLPEFEGDNNGIRRVSEVFRGEDCYGEIVLKQIYRSKIAEIADKL